MGTVIFRKALNCRFCCIAAVMVFSLATCTTPQIILYENSNGTKVRLIVDQPKSPKGVDERFKNFAALDVEAAMQRITITHSTWISLVQSDPKPLFSKDLIIELRDPLTKSLQQIKDGERIFVQFKDPYKSHDVDVAIYPDGTDLVFFFTALIRDRTEVRYNETTSDQGTLVAQPGQTLKTTPQSQTLRESIIPSEFQRAGVIARIKNRIEQSFEDKLIDSIQYTRLTAAAKHPQAAGETSWELFWERWELLKKAHEAKLISAQDYLDQQESLIGEIEK